MLEPGTRIGPYEIVAPLGAGGMGEVYRARDPRLQREVALKIPPPHLRDNPLAAERFRREAQLLAGLNHPHIAAVHGFEAGALAMELVPGDTLADRLRRGAMPVEEALLVTRQLVEAFEYAHAQGIIHRDLKPANVKLTPDDQVKVLDFGLARALNPDTSSPDLAEAATLSTPATLAGTVLGTAAYMAPEQARGKTVDQRADIWALGAVWFEMLTGRHAFPGETTSDVLAAVLRGEPDWTLLPKALPAVQRRLLQQCLQKDPKQRRQSMGDLRLALQQAPEESKQPFVAQSSRSWAMRTGYVLAGLILGALAAWVLWPKTDAPAPPSYRAVTRLAGVQMQPALSPDGRSVAFVSNRDGAFNVYVSVIGGGSMLQVTNGRELKSHPAWSPRGTLLTYAQRNASGLWDVWEIPALGGTPRLLLRDAADPTWSPDGNSLAYYRPSSGELWMSAASGEDGVKLADRVRDLDGNPKFSPDGREVAFIDEATGPYGRLDVVNLKTKALRQLAAIDAIALSPAWAPDGKTIYFASGLNGAINIWKISAQGGPLTPVTSGQGDDAELDLSGDGKKLVFSTFRTDSRVAQLDLQAAAGQNAVTLLTTDPSRNQLAPQYSPDGKRLAYFTNLKGVELEQVWTAQADGSQATPLVSDNVSNIFPRWSADGRQMFFTTDTPLDRQARRTRVAPSDGGPAQDVVTQFDLNFDVGAGNRLLYVNAGVVHSYDPAAHTTVIMLPLSTGLRPARVRWSPDANSFVFMVEAAGDADPNAGLWLKTGNAPPRQIFRGWVRDFERGPRGLIYIRAGSPDLQDALWTVDWNGQGLTRLRATLPEARDYWHSMGRSLFAVSPDGRHIAFTLDDDLQANIGMLTFAR